MTTRVGVLVRGETYYLGQRRFEIGIPDKVSDAEEDHLRRYAVDSVTVMVSDQVAEGEFRQKFEFRDMADDDFAKMQEAKQRGGGPTLLRHMSAVEDGGTAGPRITSQNEDETASRARQRPRPG